MTFALCVATMRPNTNIVGDLVHTPGDISLATANASTLPRVYVQYNTIEKNLGVIGSYQKLYEEATEDILCFMHDDVIVRERGWDKRVQREFEDETVGVVGFGGALWHGTHDLYKVPYVLQNLRRGEYRSNVDDAEVHGERFVGACDVAVLDGFVLILRRAFLERCGGFTFIDASAGFFGYDYAICAMARRLGYRIRVVGVHCHHRGGGTSVKQGEIGTSMAYVTSQEAYAKSHRWFYESFRDVMPWQCKDMQGGG